MAKIYVNTIGLVFRFQIVDQDDAIVNISSATTKTLKLQKPNGTVVTKITSFVTDGTDGLLQYTTIANDLDTAGLWKRQIQLSITGFSGHAVESEFRVESSL